MRKAERTVQALLDMIYNGELQLPEIKRGYIWTPQRAAALIADLYLARPAGQLTFWIHGEAIKTRDFSLAPPPSSPINHLSNPVYLVDGEQRLTALGKAFHDHPDTQIVFNVATQKFALKSTRTADFPWVQLSKIIGGEANPYTLVDGFPHESIQLDRNELAQRIFRVSQILQQSFDISILTESSYADVLDMCMDDRGSGRQWNISERARGSFAVSWPGVHERIQREADHWKSQDYEVIEGSFLAKALWAATTGGLSSFSVEAARTAEGDTLKEHWEHVRTGLRHLVPLLKKNLRITHGRYLKSPLTLLPLIIFLGERSREPVDDETINSLLYWLLVAIITKRNRNDSDTTLAQDIAAVRPASAATRPGSPTLALHSNLGTIGKRIKVSEQDLKDPYDLSPYLLLSFLCAQKNGARDWWFGIEVGGGGDGGQELQHHHIHPQTTLRNHQPPYPDNEIDQLANIAFISARANIRISDRSPRAYFPEVGDDQLAAHFIPLDGGLRTPNAYPDFLAERRRLLAESITAYLNHLRPSWLDLGGSGSLPPGTQLKFVRYKNSWDEGKIIATARFDDREWSGVFSAAVLLSILEDIEVRLDSQPDGDNGGDDEYYDENDWTITIGDDSVQVQLDSDSIQLQLGPFLVFGTVGEWLDVIEQHRPGSQKLADLPEFTQTQWDGDPLLFPVRKVT